jgi:hypothetical protein
MGILWAPARPSRSPISGGFRSARLLEQLIDEAGA